jgi:hypothetical protein
VGRQLVSFRERVERWAAWWKAQPKGPTPAEREAAEAEQQRRLGEAFADEVARSVVVKGVYWPGEPFDDVPTPRAGGGLFADVLEQQRQDFHWWNRS